MKPIITYMFITKHGFTTESGGLAVNSVVSSGLRCGDLRFEFRNGKRLGLNPTI